MVSIIFYYSASQEPKIKKKENIQNIENTVNLVEYRINIKGADLLVKAEKANMRSFGLIDLTNMSALYKTNSKNIEIKAKKCSISTKDNKAYLSEVVKVNSDDLFIETSSAIIDGKNQIIQGSSKITGSKQGINFSASGFSIKKDGKILLKNAKVTKEN